MTAPAPFWVNVYARKGVGVALGAPWSTRESAERYVGIICPVYRIKVTPKPQAVQP